MMLAAAKSRRSVRLWLARLTLAVGVPCVLFGGLELGLRLGGYGHSPDFFIPDGEAGMYRTNPRFTELFFPASFGLKPLNFRLPKAKPAGEFRIFVVGESAAMGVPEPGFAIAAQLRAQLRAAYPGRAIEVYNLGITAINSHAIVPIVRQAAQLQPDLFVVYMGNNEVVGPFGPSSVATTGVPPRRVIRASLWVRGTRTGQWFQGVLESFRSSGAGFKDWRGMEMFAGRTVAANDPRLATVYENFAANLGAIVGLARDAGAKVVLSTVAVNIHDCAPFASLHAAGLTPDQLAAWRAAVGRGAWDEALVIDPQFAETHFQLAQALDERRDLPGARQHFLAALQWDALRFRADARINQIVRETAQAAPEGVTLVDAAVHLGSDALSTVPPAGAGFFLEHVHLTWDGNYAIARLFAEVTAKVIGGPLAPWLNRTACAAAIGYTDFGRAGMAMSMEQRTGRPPFTNQLSYAADRGRLLAEIAAAKQAASAPGALRAMLATVEQARRRDPANAFLAFHEATVRAQLGDMAGAFELNTRLQTLQPPSPEIAAQRAFVLQELGRAAEAEAVLLRSAQEDPYYFQTYALLGRLWDATGQGPKAVLFFANLTARMPDSLAVRHAYAQALAGSGDWAAAEEQWRVILRSTPDDEVALEPLCARLNARGEGDAAVALMRAAHAYNPRSFANNARLVQIFEARGDPEETVAFMRDLAASGPVNAALHVNLARQLRQLGRPQEALTELHRAQAVATGDGDSAALATVRRMMQDMGSTTP